MQDNYSRRTGQKIAVYNQGFCTGFEIKASLEKSLNFRQLKKPLNCFGKKSGRP